MVYITVANSKRILRKLDLNDLDLTGQVYDKPLFFLNKREEQALLAYKEFMQSPEMFVEDIYQKVKVEDRFMYVYEGDAPCYHQREDCERLNAEFRNFIIPHSIRERGTDCVIRFREWFKENIYLLDGKKDIFEMRINAAVSVFEVVQVRKGPVIATGGLKNGLDAAKAIALGADMAGMALTLLPSALEGKDALFERIETIFGELKTAMFLTGATNISELAHVRYYLTGTVREMTNK